VLRAQENTAPNSSSGAARAREHSAQQFFWCCARKRTPRPTVLLVLRAHSLSREPDDRILLMLTVL
jgi:hypothetical protein